MSKFEIKELVKIKDQNVLSALSNLEPENATSFKGNLQVIFIYTSFFDEGKPSQIYVCVPVDKYFPPTKDYAFIEDQLEKIQ